MDIPLQLPGTLPADLFKLTISVQDTESNGDLPVVIYGSRDDLIALHCLVDLLVKEVNKRGEQDG